MNKFKFFLKAARPKQWSKNLFVFAAPLFAYNFNIQILINSLIAFILFSTISSAIYFLNDAIDIEKDKLHPKKKFRPIAYGYISQKEAIKTSIILLIFGNALAFIFNKYFGIIIIIYSLIQISYCTYLKDKPILDIYCISSGFLLRALAGGVSTGVNLSPWFMLTVFLIALFLAIEKRKAELRFFLSSGSLGKNVLKSYSLNLLIRLENIVSTGSFITYSLWASGPLLNGAKTSWMLITIPFVLYGIFRYQLLSEHNKSNIEKNLQSFTAEAPEELLLNDKVLQINIALWLLTTLIIFKLTS
tara:strand:- start:4258 stop:5163 length:906 start_codon:yes stop_codon:yes gene_type:complete